jgi:hypothetical protein
MPDNLLSVKFSDLGAVAHAGFVVPGWVNPIGMGFEHAAAATSTGGAAPWSRSRGKWRAIREASGLGVNQLAARAASRGRSRGRFQACRLALSRVGYGDAVAGETDEGGNRSRALDEFLEARLVEGYRIEAHEATHAIVVQGDSILRRLLRRRQRRFVVQVDDHGTVSMRPAEPVRH